MARSYKPTVGRRVTGQPRSTPLRLHEHDDHRYVVAPYGPVGDEFDVEAVAG